MPVWTGTGDIKPGSQAWENMIAGMSPEERRVFYRRWNGDVIDLPADAVREVNEVPKLEAPKGE
jgi:hypothetical protein